MNFLKNKVTLKRTVPYKDLLYMKQYKSVTLAHGYFTPVRCRLYLLFFFLLIFKIKLKSFSRRLLGNRGLGDGGNA